MPDNDLHTKQEKVATIVHIKHENSNLKWNHRVEPIRGWQAFGSQGQGYANMALPARFFHRYGLCNQAQLCSVQQRKP